MRMLVLLSLALNGLAHCRFSSAHTKSSYVGTAYVSLGCEPLSFMVHKDMVTGNALRAFTVPPGSRVAACSADDSAAQH